VSRLTDWAYVNLNKVTSNFECQNMRGTMKTEEADILVIGAGPAGLISACKAASKKADVVVLEEHEKIGQPCHCAGLLSLKGLERLGIPADGPYVQNKVKGARFFSPSGLSFTVEKDEPVACVVDRRLFDRFLAKKTTEAGARISLNKEVKSIERGEKKVIIQIEKEKYYAKMGIDAEGVSARITKAIGLKPLDRDLTLSGLQYDLENVGIDQNYVEVHIGRNTAPCFFAWVIPLSKGRARVGLGCKGVNPKELLEEFVTRRFGDEDDLEWGDVRSGLIITGGPIDRTFSDKFLAVGDAAGQVKPTTGGGVILGGTCASIAGETAAEAVACRDCSASFLSRYENLWKDELSKDFRMMLLARRVMNRLSDRALNKLFNIVTKENLQELFSAEGDMDFQSGVLLRLLKKKEILGVLPSFLRALIPF
jgi:digeranylgeranylglycerophospholipid reductase